MPAPIEPSKLYAAMQELGISANELQAIQRLPFVEGQARFAEIKERVHKNYKRLAFELHPDRTGNDPEKTERFKLIGTVKVDFDKLRLEQRPQPVQVMPQMQVIRVVTWASASHVSTASTTTTTTTTIPFGAPYRVATMRPQ